MIRLLAYRNFHANTHSHLKTTTHRPPLGPAEPWTRKACIDAFLHEKLVKQTRPGGYCRYHLTALLTGMA